MGLGIRLHLEEWGQKKVLNWYQKELGKGDFVGRGVAGEKNFLIFLIF